MSSPRSFRRSRPAVSIAFVIVIVYTFWLWQPFRPMLNEPIVEVANDVQTTDRLVPLEAHIMSKCPDAKVTTCSVSYCLLQQMLIIYRKLLSF
jgi:hypothetical protein